MVGEASYAFCLITSGVLPLWLGFFGRAGGGDVIAGHI